MHSPGAWCALSPLCSQLQFLQTSPVHLVSVLGSLSLAVTSQQMSTIQNLKKPLVRNLEACLQLGRGCRLWGRVFPFPDLAGACLPPASCLRRGMGQSTAAN